jgi:hypothetical protein
MADIVDRLRERAHQYDEYAWHGDIELEAAETIESLRRQIRDMHERHQQEKIMLYAQLAKQFETLCHITETRSPSPIFLTKVIE